MGGFKENLILRFPFHSLKTSVMAHLAFLILAAMLLMNVVMIKLAEDHLVQNELQTGRLLLNALEQIASHEFSGSATWQASGSHPRFRKTVSHLLNSGPFTMAMVLNGRGIKIFSQGPWGPSEKSALAISRQCLSTREPCLSFSGSTWGVLWLAHDSIYMSTPVLAGTRPSGVVTIGTSLKPLYQKLRRSEGFVLIYIFLNGVILVFFGVRLLSRTVVTPIRKLLHITEEFKDVESVPPIKDISPDEIGQLSRSLNTMLRRLEENKKDLRTYISSLEEANREIKKAQDEIIRSEKFASVGRLATGVAHEIGNPIGIVLGYLDLLKTGDPSGKEYRDFLERMESEITRISRIIRDLLDFSRSPEGSLSRVDIHALLTDTLNMLSPQPMMAHIRMKPMFNAQKHTVRADPNQLKQVFLNLIINAADAMQDDSRHGAFRDHLLNIQTKQKGNTLELHFEDTGPGIRAEELAHIFDPFYTTKEPGRGTGLGLSVSYSIIDRLGGKIRVESTFGSGTTVIVSLPLDPDQSVPEKEAEKSLEPRNRALTGATPCLDNVCS